MEAYLFNLLLGVGSSLVILLGILVLLCIAVPSRWKLFLMLFISVAALLVGFQATRPSLTYKHNTTQSVPTYVHSREGTIVDNEKVTELVDVEEVLAK